MLQKLKPLRALSGPCFDRSDLFLMTCSFTRLMASGAISERHQVIILNIAQISIRFSLLALTLASLTFGAGSAQAQEAAHEHTHEKFDLPLTHGHSTFDINGAFAYLNDKDFQSATVAVGYEHFCFDNLSVGGAVAATWSSFSKRTALLLSPSATYYFLSQDRWSPFASQRLSYNTDTADLAGATALGIAFFLNPHVAITPRLNYQYALNEREQNQFFSIPEESLDFAFGLAFYF